jgi:hypothetical protein
MQRLQTIPGVAGEMISSLRSVVIVESPFAGDIAINRRYAIDACADCFRRGETPFASHLLYPQILNEMNKDEREKGIMAGYAFWPLARLITFYVDLGWSPGMQRAKRRVVDLGYNWEERSLSTLR